MRSKTKAPSRRPVVKFCPHGRFFLLAAAAMWLASAAVALAEMPLAHADVVLLHGKAGNRTWMEPLARALRQDGARVEAPLMSWSRERIYDLSYDDSLQELRTIVRRLGDGHRRHVFLAGHSLGANAALGYAARHGGLAGVVLLAPGHIPETTEFSMHVQGSLARAQAMVGAGRGEQRFAAEDIDQGYRLRIVTTPFIYLSWMSADGPANMARNALSLGAAIPVLWVAGNRDPIAAESGKVHVFDKLAPHPLTRAVLIDADHLGTPGRAIDEVRTWLRAVVSAANGAAGGER